MLPLNVFLNKDCISGMREIPDNSIDLILADPPYNLSKGSQIVWNNEEKSLGMGGKWNKVMEDWDDMSLSDYLAFSKSWLKEAQRILKPTGSMWIFGTYHNIGLINFICQYLGIEIINEVVWYKRNSFPNLRGRRLTASHETILWCNKGTGKREYYFDYDYSKSSYFKNDMLKIANKQMRTVWDIPNNKESREYAYGKHPTQKPLAILKRMIHLSSKPGDICLSPFGGVGSECLAAKETSRSYIGFELEESFCKIASERLKHAILDKENLQTNLNLSYEQPGESSNE